MSQRIVPSLRSFSAPTVPAQSDGPLRVLTLNCAHGRGLSAHQLFLPKERIERNLESIAEVLRRERPHLVGLQEVDQRSAWNGNFDNLEYLAEKAEYQFGILGEHMRKLSLRYGTALLSNFAISDPLSLRLPSSGLLPPKGFVIGSIPWPSNEQLYVDVVSLHLDFVRSRVRFRQIDALLDELRGRARPQIVMGDFNCTFRDTLSAVKRLMIECNLRAFEPQEPVSTFRYRKKRWDWILLSEEFRFVSHRVLADPLSDHFAVCADVALSEG